MITSSRLSPNCYEAHKFSHRCAVRYTKIDSIREGTRANLTPKMSELEIIDAIGGHYPNFIQHALLSGNIKTIQEALSFFNKLQVMEDGETRNSLNREPSMSRPEHSSSAGQNQSGRYRPTFQTQNIRYAHYRENLSDDQNKQYYQHSTS